MIPILLVAAGGALGAVARFLVGSAFSRASWPWGTLLINVTGCFLVAIFTARFSSANLRYLLPIGFVGAYTTFSAYEYETMRLFEMGKAFAGVAYVVVSNVLGLGGVMLGAWVARR